MGHRCTLHFQIVVIGDFATGKSALASTFATDEYNENTVPTVGVDFFVKTVHLDDGVMVRLQIWDTAGQERYKALTQSYYHSSMGVVLVYDVTNRSSFIHIIDWLQQARKYTQSVVFQLIACKCDLDKQKWQVTPEEGRVLANSYQIGFIETSSRNLYNVKEAFVALSRTIHGKVSSGEMQANHINIENSLNLTTEKTANKCSRQQQCNICQVC